MLMNYKITAHLKSGKEVTFTLSMPGVAAQLFKGFREAHSRYIVRGTCEFMKETIPYDSIEYLSEERIKESE